MDKIYEEIPVGRAKDLRNQKFNNLTVLYRTKNIKKSTQWVCQCVCGNQCVASMSHLTSGHTTSCGCYKKSVSFNDIVGQKFGKLTVLKYDKTKGKGHTYWICKCDCGTEKSIRKDGLISGAVISCGCYHKEKTSEIFTKDLTGQKFGKLTVLERAGSNKHKTALWLCECICGTKKIIPSSALIKGESKSCGCIKSFGETKIKELLNNNNITFIQEKTFPTCKFKDTNRLAKFDFFINDTYLIEFDGSQHFKSGTGWNTEEKFQKTQEHDIYKNQWCKENGIPLIRIPFSKLDTLTIEDLLLNTSNFIQE